MGARAGPGVGQLPDRGPTPTGIADGCFEWRGRSYRLDPNFPGSPHCCTAWGWLAAWQVQAPPGPSGPAEVGALTLEHHADGGWPFDFSARQIFQLARPAALRSVVTNIGAEPAPVGPAGTGTLSGRQARSRLHGSAAGAGRSDTSKLPVQPCAARCRRRRRAPGLRPLPRAGSVRTDPRRKRHVDAACSSRAARDLYATGRRPFLPSSRWSHVRNAINQPAPSALGFGDASSPARATRPG